ncbi:type VII secretion target [Actinoplanes sp. NBC_00393]|uniref:type VII secretion target n=1 Tax=Actinoplanes sp. NBC_00393 TaxID=2975953 RepID=UPI002E229A47
MEDGLAVDVPALRACATGTQAAGNTLKAAMSAAEHRLATTSEPGWSSATAIRAAEQVWEAHLRRLTAEIEGFSAALTAAADDYTRTDEAGGQRIRGAGQVPR